MANEPTHLDLRKQPVQVGDTLAVSFRSGNTAELRLGTVVGFTTRKASYTSTLVPLIEVDWDPEITRYPKSSKIEANNGRYVIINRNSLPND